MRTALLLNEIHFLWAKRSNDVRFVAGCVWFLIKCNVVEGQKKCFKNVSVNYFCGMRSVKMYFCCYYLPFCTRIKRQTRWESRRVSSLMLKPFWITWHHKWGTDEITGQHVRELFPHSASEHTAQRPDKNKYNQKNKTHTRHSRGKNRRETETLVRNVRL